MMVSNDNGESWSAPTRLFDLVGSNGAASLVADSSNTLHLFFGNRDSNLLTHGVWHSTWLGEGWSIPVAVVSGPQILVGESGEEGFDPSNTQAVICQGNIIFVAWRHDPMAGPAHIWFTYLYLDSLPLPIQPISSPVTSAAATPVPTSFPSAADATIEEYDDNSNAIQSLPLNQILLLSIVPVLILFIVLILWQRKRR
jgi:hypothetical protein